MIKNITFTQSGPRILANLRPLKDEDLKAPTPDTFNNPYDGYGILSLCDFLGMIFPDGDTTQKPYIYIRHTDMLKKQVRFGNLVELGDDWLSPQKGVIHQEDIGQAGAAMSEYRQIDDKTSGYDILEPKASFTYTKEGWSINEHDFFHLEADAWPLAIIDHQSMYKDVSTVIQAATMYGILDGKPVQAVGEHDRLFIPSQVRGFDGITNKFGYFYMNMLGIREDGRREQCLISIGLADGKNLAYYYIDGQQPILTDTVSMETEWTHLPYVDDGTCVYKDAIFRFAGKEFHFYGKWGSKGFTPQPRVEKHGQSQIFGTWHEGPTPYKHRLYTTFGENMEAYDYKLKDLGFDITD